MNFQELYRRIEALDRPINEEPNEGNAFSGALDAAKDAGQDEFDVDGKTFQVKENDVEECGMGSMPMSSPKQQDNVTMNVSMNGSGSGGIKDLLDILRNIENNSDSEGDDLGDLIGQMDSPSSGEKAVIVGDSIDGEFSNATTEPNPEYQDTDYMTKDISGGFGTQQTMHPHGYQNADNPLAMETLKSKLSNLYQEVKLRESSGEQVDEWGVNLTQPNAGVLGRNPGAPYQDNANLNRVAAKYDDYIKKYEQEIKELKASSTATMPGTVGLIRTLEKSVDELKSEKIHNMMAGSIADNTNAQRKQAIANNELTPGQWLQKATQYFKGKITGKEQPGVEYDHIDNSKQGKPGWDTPTPYKPAAVPMKESNEIIKLSKMLNG